MATLWPDSDGDRQAQNLRRALADVRAGLGLAVADGSVVRASLDTLALVGGFEVDLGLLREFVERPSFENAALAGYRGPLLEGLEGPWIESARAEAEHLFAVGHLKLLAQVRTRGHLEVLRERLLHSIPLVPLREDLRVALIEVHSRLGENHEALRQLESLSTMLDDEFGESPSSEAIRALNLAPDHFPNLREEPIFEREAIGRRELVEQCLAWVPGPVQLTTLAGVAGVGKTTTARAVVRVAESQMAVAWVELGLLSGADQVWGALGRALGLGPAAHSPQALRDGLAESPVLVVFDNAEHLLPEVAGLIEQVATWPGTQVLVTSRRVLGVSGERVLPVENLAVGGDSEGVEGPAVRLFLTRLRDRQPGFVPTPTDLGAIVEICQRVEGHPFSLELIANDGQDFAPSELLSMLKAPVADEVRESQLTRLLSHGFSSLSAGCRSLLLAVSLFPGRFDLEEAESLVTGCEGDLRQLVLGSFLKEVEGGYHLPFVVREFTRPQVSAEVRRVQEGVVLKALARRTERCRALAAGPGIAAAMLEMGSLDANAFYLATTLLEEGEVGVHEAAAECAFNLYLYLQSAGRRDEWRAVVQVLLGKEISGRHRALLWFVEGQWQMSMGDIRLARQAYQRALDTPCELLQGFEPEAFRIAYLVAHTIRGDDASEHAEWVGAELEGLRVRLRGESERVGGGWDLLGVRVGVASTLGATLRVQGRHSEAIEVLTEGRDLALEHGHWRALGLLSHGIGDNAMDRGDFKMGSRAIREALEAYDRCGIPGYGNPACEALGLAHLALGEVDSVPEVLDRLFQSWQEHRSSVWTHLFFVLAATFRKLGDEETAHRCFGLGRATNAPQAVYGRIFLSFFPPAWLEEPIEPPPDPLRSRLTYARYRRALGEALLRRSAMGEERTGTS